MPKEKSQNWLVNIFNEPNHNFQQYAEFTSIEQIKKANDNSRGKKTLKKRENFWILKLKNLFLNGLTEELNDTD